MTQHGPFGQLGSAPVTSVSGPSPVSIQGGQPIPPFQMPTTAPAGSFAGMFFPSKEAVRSENLTAYRRAVLDAVNRGQEVGQAMMSVLNSSVGAAAINDPDFPKTAQEFVDFLTPEPEATVSKSAAPQGEFDKFSPEEKKRFFGVEGAEDTAAEKLTDAIIDAEGRARGGDANAKREVTLLLKHLPKDAQTGELNLKAFVTLTAAGVSVKNPPYGLDKMSVETANTVLGLLQVPKDRALTEYEMILIGLGEIANPDITAEAAEATVIVKQEIRKQKRSSDLGEILALTGQADLAAQVTEGETDLGELFRKHREGGAGAGEAKGATTPPGPTAPPVAGAPQQAKTAAVGGKAGQATGPSLDIPVSPEVRATYEAIPPEQFAKFDLNTLAIIASALVKGEITLSDEQRAALLAAITAANAAEAGGAGGAEQ